MLLPTITSGKIRTHTRTLVQDIPNSIVHFTADAFHQDFVLFGLPANHMILGVKIVVIENFEPGLGNNLVLYVGEPNVFPVPDGSPSGNFVTNVADCYGVHTIKVPAGADATYQYGSFRWFSLSAPGSNVSSARCLPRRTDAHDVIARVVVSGNNSPRIDTISTGVVEITTQYIAI